MGLQFAGRGGSDAAPPPPWRASASLSIPTAVPFISIGASGICSPSAKAIPGKGPSLQIFLSKLNRLRKLDWFACTALT